MSEPAFEPPVQEAPIADQTQPEPETIAQDLQEKLQAIRMITMTHQLLQVGHFNFANQPAVNQALAFQKELYTNMMAEVKVHPDALKVPELAAKIEADKHGQG